MAASDENLVRDLGDGFPELRPVVRNHLYENFGEVLPGRLLGEILRFALDSNHHAKPILDFLEERYRSGDHAVKELIAGSFVEPLVRHGEAGHDLRILLGPALASAAARAEPLG